MRFGKGATVFVFVQVLVFTVVCLWFSWCEKALPDALIYSFYAWFGAEGGCLAWLKIAERKAKTDKQLAAENAALKKDLSKLRKAANKSVSALEGQMKIDSA